MWVAVGVVISSMVVQVVRVDGHRLHCAGHHHCWHLIIVFILPSSPLLPSHHGIFHGHGIAVNVVVQTQVQVQVQVQVQESLLSSSLCWCKDISIDMLSWHWPCMLLRRGCGIQGSRGCGCAVDAGHLHLHRPGNCGCGCGRWHPIGWNSRIVDKVVMVVITLVVGVAIVIVHGLLAGVSTRDCVGSNLPWVQ